MNEYINWFLMLLSHFHCTLCTNMWHCHTNRKKDRHDVDVKEIIFGYSNYITLNLVCL